MLKQYIVGTTDTQLQAALEDVGSFVVMGDLIIRKDHNKSTRKSFIGIAEENTILCNALKNLYNKQQAREQHGTL